jgi:hypothetical protein
MGKLAIKRGQSEEMAERIVEWAGPIYEGVERGECEG